MPPEFVNPPLYAAVTTFVSRYLMNLDTNVTMHGIPTSSPYDVLNPAFSALNVTAAFPGVGAQILLSGTMYISRASLHDKKSNATLHLHNPVNVALVRGSRRG